MFHIERPSSESNSLEFSSKKEKVANVIKNPDEISFDIPSNIIQLAEKQRAHDEIAATVALDALKNVTHEGRQISKAHFQFERDRLAQSLREARKKEQPERQGGLQQEVSRLYNELPKRTIEEVSKHTGAIFVHTIIDEDSAYRQKKDTTGEENLDTLLALQPSISASTIIPGHVDQKGDTYGMWGQEHQDGVVLGRGQIGQASSQDFVTRPFGIKERGSVSDWKRIGAMEELLQIAGNKEDVGSYNELVINNPEIIGYFKRGLKDEKGMIWIQDPATLTEPINNHLKRLRLASINPMRFLSKEYRQKYLSELQEFDKRIKAYREKIEVVRARGLTVYIMTPDRRLFEIQKVNNNGTVDIGEELTPEIAIEKQGISIEERKKIGERIVRNGKRLFHSLKDQQEAEEIIKGLSATVLKIPDEMREAA
ncbi:MAG: hypothetical protein Q8Q10_02260 [bacterium]|nr:hypothetical protein [bacterium]